MARHDDRARIARLSPTLTATIHGRGAVILIRGADRLLSMNDAEARALRDAIDEWETARRAESDSPRREPSDPVGRRT